MFVSLSIRRLFPKITFYALVLVAVSAALLHLSNQRENSAYVPVNLSLNTGGRRILVIDPGHGGEDGGASSVGGTLEAPINLQIAKKLEMLAFLWGVETVMTRDTDDITYPESANTTRERKRFDQRRRVEIINSVDNPVFVSIHLNKFTSTAPRGPQALYSRQEGSGELAEIAQRNLLAMVYPESRREPARIPESVYLFTKIICPGIIVECGFLSNPEDERLLLSPEHQLKLAAAILASYAQFETAQ